MKKTRAKVEEYLGCTNASTEELNTQYLNSADIGEKIDSAAEPVIPHGLKGRYEIKNIPD